MKKNALARLDASETAAFLRQAEHVMAETFDVEFPELMALSLIPIRNDGGPGARTIVYRQFDRRGMAMIVNNYAKDFPRVDISGKEFTQPVKSIGDAYGWNIQELNEALHDNLPLDSMRAITAKEAISQKLNSIGFFGDPESGMRGIITHPNVTKAAATTGNWAAATNDQRLADVNNMLQNVKTLTKGVESFDTVMMPIAKLGLLATTFYSTTAPMSLLKVLQEGNPGVNFVGVNECAALSVNPRTGGAGPVDVMVAFRANPRKIWFSVPVPFEQMPPQPAGGMDWEVICHARTAGVIIPYPLSVSVVDGI